MKENLQIDFGITIDYDKSISYPQRVFDTMSNIIKTFEILDHDLANCINSTIQPVLTIEELEVGSIKSIFRNLIKSVDDDALKDLDIKKIVGKYLVEGKYKILDFLKDKDELVDKSELLELQNDLLLSAKETDIMQIPSYSPIPLYRLTEDVQMLANSAKLLSNSDSMIFHTKDKEVSFNKKFTLTDEQIEELLTIDIIENDCIIIFKIKKPDYIGESMWEFVHGGRIIKAKISDVSWLEKFHAREEHINSGDSLKCRVKSVLKYNQNHELISESYDIYKILKVLEDNQGEQTRLQF